jgi:flavin-dependent dehydrogenase
VRVGIVGGGPAGALLAHLLARDGAGATLFDASHPREKPCGGGITAKAMALLPEAPPDDPLPARAVSTCRFESGAGEAVQIEMARPVAIAARRELDAWLLRRATSAGATHASERVVGISADARLRTADGREHAFDVVVGADGAGSLVRRTLLGATPAGRLMMAAGWFAKGDAPMLVRFVPGLAGYMWLFPRSDHVGVGICAPLRALPTRRLLARLEAEVAASFPALGGAGTRRYAHTIPSPSAEEGSLLRVAGARWALVGDAAALADPITGEGIYYALRSAQLLAETLRRSGSPAGYPARLLEDCGGELLRAARLLERFYAEGFSRRVVRYAARSPAIRAVLAELVLGEQGYAGLKPRLLRALPRFLWDSLAATLSDGSGARP